MWTVLLIGLFTSSPISAKEPSLPSDNWYRCTSDIHCIKKADLCGEFVAINENFIAPHSLYIEKQSQIVDCAGDPPPENKEAVKYNDEMKRRRRLLKPYCKLNKCALR